MVPITIDEVQEIARNKLPDNVYNYYACGADNEKALNRNRKMFERLFIKPRVMVDVTNVDTSMEIFGKQYPYPIAFAPSAMQKLAHPDGETGVAAAAAKLGLMMTLSSQSTTSLEDVAATHNGSLTLPDLWFQLYLTIDPVRSIPLIKRAADAGYKALVLTVDTPILGNRINERKTPLILPAGLALANYTQTGPNTPSKPAFERILLNAHSAYEAKEILKSADSSLHSTALTWQDTLPWLRSVTDMKIILKGVMTEEDAELAVKHGADAIIVSNHGGRQLDCTASTIEVLPGIASAVGGRIPVIMDGGIRHGSDVYKAVALGANLVMIGRPVLWGLGYKGSEGVEVVANILEREFTRTMALAGVTKVKDITRRSVGVMNRDGFGMARL